MKRPVAAVMIALGSLCALLVGMVLLLIVTMRPNPEYEVDSYAQLAREAAREGMALPDESMLPDVERSYILEGADRTLLGRPDSYKIVCYFDGARQFQVAARKTDRPDSEEIELHRYDACFFADGCGYYVYWKDLPEEVRQLGLEIIQSLAEAAGSGTKLP